MRGPALLEALENSALPVRLKRGRNDSGDISVAVALVLVRAGDYEGRITARGCVKWIRNTDRRGPVRWTENWRTAEAAVLQPYQITGNYSFAQAQTA